MNITVQANRCFKEVDLSRKRYVVMKGSAGSGKSVDTAQNYILRLMTDPGRSFYVSGKRMSRTGTAPLQNCRVLSFVCLGQLMQDIGTSTAVE